MTPLFYYAHVLLDKATETGRVRDIERACSELVRALRAADRL